MASQLPEDAWAGEWREFVSHAGNPCGSPSPVLRRRVQNSITEAAKISLPGLQNGLLEVSAEIVAGRLCGLSRGGQRVSGRTFWGTFATHARSMRNDKHGSKNQHVGSALNRFRIDSGSLQIDRGTRIEPGIGHAVGPLARRICGFVMVSCREAASERPASSPAGKYLWGDTTSVHASAHLSR